MLAGLSFLGWGLYGAFRAATLGPWNPGRSILVGLLLLAVAHGTARGSRRWG